MSVREFALPGRATGLGRRASAEWDALDARVQCAVKVGVLLLATVAAYHYSLQSLFSMLTSDTPLAYLGLVPLFAAGLAWVHRSPRRVEPQIHDRQLDYTIGVPLILVATLAANVLPKRLGAMAWVNRLDLLFLPLFVIGATVLIFGVRVAWRQKAALGYLFLLWPWPYVAVLLGAFDGFRSLTLRGLNAVMHVVPVASSLGAAEAGRYQIVHDGQPFTVSVVTACSGVNGMVGFFLVGIALMLCSRGPAYRKALWIAAGLVWLWLINLLRLVGVFAIGAARGPHVAFDLVHPGVGLVTFALGVAAIVAVMPLFGLELAGREQISSSAPGPRRRGSSARSLRTGAALVLAAAVVVSTGNAALARFDPVANAAGAPRLSSFLANPATPVGWTPAFHSEVTKNKAMFGESSRWFRYLYMPTSPKAAKLSSTLPVTADVVNEQGLSGFREYGVTACYSFHGYKLRDITAVDLGNGVTGQTMSWAGRTATQNWSIVYWILPVRTGDGTRYERVTLYIQNTSERRLSVNRAFLVGFAREIVRLQRAHKDFDVRVTVMQRPDGARAAWLADATGNRGKVDPHNAFWRAYFKKHKTQSNVAKGSKP